MLLRRIIPVILMRSRTAVQSRGFRRYQALGHPLVTAQRLSDWASDELILLDITPANAVPAAAERTEVRHPSDDVRLEMLGQIAEACFMPLSFGGGIRSVEDAEAAIMCGADKVTLRSAAIETPGVITDLADRFGSQCVVVAMDVLRAADPASGSEHAPHAEWALRSHAGDRPCRDPGEVARQMQERGAGEILLQSVDRDGSGEGYDLALLRMVSAAVSIPVVALGGAGSWSHMKDALNAGADAVAAANIFNHTEHAVHHARAWLHAEGLPVRPPYFAESGADLAGHAIVECIS